MVIEKPTVPARLGTRPNRSGGWSRILLLAASECSAGKSALETAVACFARRRLPIKVVRSQTHS
jgi:hypothetical protein